MTNDHRNNKEPSFSIYEFKDWFAKQSNPSHKKPSKSQEFPWVESRLGIQRLEAQIAAHNNDLTSEDVSKMALSFKTSGGMILGENDLNITIEVPKGEFTLPKYYTKPSERR